MVGSFLDKSVSYGSMCIEASTVDFKSFLIGFFSMCLLDGADGDNYYWGHHFSWFSSQIVTAIRLNN